MGSRAQERCEQCWQLVWPWNLCERDKYRIPENTEQVGEGSLVISASFLCSACKCHKE